MRFNFSMCLVFLISFATLLWQPCDAVAQEKKLPPEKLKPAYTVVWTELFKQPELKAEFGITDEQADQMRNGFLEKKPRLKKRLTDLKQLRETNLDDYVKLAKDLTRKDPTLELKVVRDALSPQQTERLMQLGYWSSINEFGYSEVILNDGFAKQIGLENSQRQNLLEKSKKLRQDFDAEVLQLRLKYFKRIMDKSGVGETKKVKDLMDQLKNPPKNPNPIQF